MKYALQKKGYGLGNFIMMTPALRLLNKRVNVFFTNRHIASLYRDCSFINILGREPKNKPFLSSEKPKRNKGESDTEAYCRKVIGRLPKNIPNTYVDKCEDLSLVKYKDTKYVALFHGCLGKIFRRKKNLGLITRQWMIDRVLEKGYIPVLLGSAGDYEHFWSYNNLDGCVNLIDKCSLRESVSILNQCDMFISNDTGLYHAAGALEKPGLVMWKSTSKTKNMCVFKGIEHIKKDYAYEIKSFLNRQ